MYRILITKTLLFNINQIVENILENNFVREHFYNHLVHCKLNLFSLLSCNVKNPITKFLNPENDFIFSKTKNIFSSIFLNIQRVKIAKTSKHTKG